MKIKDNYDYGPQGYHQAPVTILTVSETKANNVLVRNSWNTWGPLRALAIQERARQMRCWEAVPGPSHASGHLIPVS